MSISTEIGFERMTAALPYMVEILSDKKLQAYRAESRENTADNSVSKMMQAILPVFLVTKKETVMALIGALSGKTAEEVAAQDWKETMSVIKSPLMDDFNGFFIWSVSMARNA